MHEVWDNKEAIINTFNEFAASSNSLVVMESQMLSSISPQNIRIIEREPVILSDINQFNQQILGPELAKTLEWQPWLAIIMKYLFSKELLIELQQVFKQIESKFYQRKQSSFSSGDKILISLMRVLASWDKEVSILVVDECTALLDTQLNALFLKCLAELSVRTSVYLGAQRAFNLDCPAKINLG